MDEEEFVDEFDDEGVDEEEFVDEGVDEEDFVFVLMQCRCMNR